MSKPSHSPRDLNEFEQLIVGPRPLVAEFGAAWCPPCRQLEALLGELAQTYRHRVDVVSIDIEISQEIAATYRVRSVPTLLAFRAGAIVASQVGFGRRAPLDDLFESLAADAVAAQAIAASP